MTKFSKLILLLSFLLTAVACSEDYQGPVPYPTLIETANEAGLTTLVTAVRAIPGLEATLQSQSAITVFAPTNDAFANALAEFEAADLNDLVAKLGGPGNLETVLGFHVVPSIVFSRNMDETTFLTTLSGQRLVVSADPTKRNITVTDAAGNVSRVLQADVRFENGVAHVINRVLIPSIELPKPNLVEAATDLGLTTLLSAVTAVNGLPNALLSANQITVFAPTNEAFAAALAAFKANNLNELVVKIGGPANLEKVLGFHVVPAVAFSANLNATNTFTTLSGQTIVVEKSGNTVSVRDQLGRVAQVVTADIEISNGVIHVLNGVMLPDLMLPTVVQAAQSAGLTTLLNAVTAAGLGNTLLNQQAMTVFAPSNAAFSAALTAFGAADLNQLVAKIGGMANLQKVLGFHVVPAVAFSADLAATNTFTTLAGEQLTVTKNTAGAVTVRDRAGNTYNVTTADVAIRNGVVHVIDGVLLPTIDLPNVVEAAQAANLTVLLQAVTAANLGNTLLSQQSMTVFAPTNQAFSNLLSSLGLSSLTELINTLGADVVSKVLGFHVVPTTAFSFNLAQGAQQVPTLAGEMLTVTRTGNNVTVTDKAGKTYTVVVADVAIENGVVHVIDGVLLPTL
ncbi:MAG: fasciclin domain-containing protein [Cyclobacteriaceae bacterium]|nr:fasciclin domain-containing protein [Cyclobacteriaceae bacterium]MDX5465839.1 fasciclin domain-containing protein [Cyclobacteriaceae bacterium]